MAEMPPRFRFFRPILWDNSNSEYPYSIGGTANIVRFLDHFFILSAKHCLVRDGYSIGDLRIPWRLGSESCCEFARGVQFSLPDSDRYESVLSDVQILGLGGPSSPEPDLEPGEYLDIQAFEPNEHFLQRFLTGFPTEEQFQNYSAGEVGGIGRLIAGEDGGPTNDFGCKFFRSESLIGKDADGFSGGLITSDVLGNVQLEGICVQGGGNRDIDFVRFITVDVLRHQFFKTWETLMTQSGRREILTPAPHTTGHTGP